MMILYSKKIQGRVSAIMLHYRWPFLLMLYVMGMAHTEAICHPPPVLFNNRAAISELEIINQISWPAPILTPDNLIHELTVPNFVNRLDVMTPATDDYNPLSPGEKWSGFKKRENTPLNNY